MSECIEDCPMCSGEYCRTHGTEACECDTMDRHDVPRAASLSTPEARGRAAMSKSRSRKAVEIVAVYTVEQNAAGEDIGNLSLSMPNALRVRWKRWPERKRLLDLLHEMGRAATYDRPLRRVKGR